MNEVALITKQCTICMQKYEDVENSPKGCFHCNADVSLTHQLFGEGCIRFVSCPQCRAKILEVKRVESKPVEIKK